MIANIPNQSLAGKVEKIILEAGRVLKAVYASGDFGITQKSDGFPLTRADLAANDIIVPALQTLTPNILVVSEETTVATGVDRLKQSQIWLVDPLDGTKEFIRKSHDFTVNIGLIENGKPVFGMIYAPLHALLYWGGTGLGAWKRSDTGKFEAIKVNRSSRKPIVAISRSHQSPETSAFIHKLGNHSEAVIGSSLKFCYVADGTVDIYPRLTPCMEWDTAAGDAILREAGGSVRQYDTGKQLSYNKSDFHNPFFVANGKTPELQFNFAYG